MVKTFLRIIGSRSDEELFIRMSMDEADGAVDHIILTEHNFTHSGISQEYVFQDIFPPHKVLPAGTHFWYRPIAIDNEVVHNAKSSGDLHLNETLTRGTFERVIDISRNDVVIAVDADEVVYKSSFDSLLRRAVRDPLRRRWAIQMHQFFYRMDYLWSNLIFRSAVIGRTSAMRRGRTPWRDSRWIVPGIHGCHFSWVLSSPEEMVKKLRAYSHALDYGHLASKDIMRNAVESKTYPFDPSRPFEIRELSSQEFDSFFPQSWREYGSEIGKLLQK